MSKSQKRKLWDLIEHDAQKNDSYFKNQKNRDIFEQELKALWGSRIRRGLIWEIFSELQDDAAIRRKEALRPISNDQRMSVMETVVETDEVEHDGDAMTLTQNVRFSILKENGLHSEVSDVENVEVEHGQHDTVNTLSVGPVFSGDAVSVLVHEDVEAKDEEEEHERSLQMTMDEHFGSRSPVEFDMAPVDDSKSMETSNMYQMQFETFDGLYNLSENERDS